MRTCLVCRGRYPKTELFRLVYHGSIIADHKQVLNGRGRYICKNGCHLKAGDIKLFRRAFRDNTISIEDVNAVLEELAE